MVIDGRAIAQHTLAALKQKKTKKVFAAILVGADPISLYFLKQQKERVAKFLGVRFKLHRLSASASSQKLHQKIRELNNDPRVGGIVLQLPLPARFDRNSAVSLIDERKDVDALNFPGPALPPAVLVTKKIFEHIGIKRLTNKRIVIVGRGFLIGRPIADWLRSRGKKVTVFHSKYFSKPVLKRADIVISGVGKPRFIKGEWVKRGAVLIDFGYGKIDGHTAGDFDFESCLPVASYITPTPGGTGPILVAQLFENFFKLVRSSR